MRNKYEGFCYRCGKKVGIREGHFERFQGRWRTQHATCAIEHRKLRENNKKRSSLEGGEQDAR